MRKRRSRYALNPIGPPGWGFNFRSALQISSRNARRWSPGIAPIKSQNMPASCSFGMRALICAIAIGSSFPELRLASINSPVSRRRASLSGDSTPLAPFSPPVPRALLRVAACQRVLQTERPGSVSVNSSPSPLAGFSRRQAARKQIAVKMKRHRLINIALGHGVVSCPFSTLPLNSHASQEER